MLILFISDKERINIKCILCVKVYLYVKKISLFSVVFYWAKISALEFKGVGKNTIIEMVPAEKREVYTHARVTVAGLSTACSYSMHNPERGILLNPLARVIVSQRP